ncbi:MAG: trigger factor [bacterium]
MKINSQTREGNKIILEVEVDYSQFLAAVDKTLGEAGKQIKIPGFREGKAPKEMVERAIDRKYLESQAAQNLIGDLYPKIIEETKIEPVDYPNIEILEQKKKKPFVFKVTVDVYPDVELGKYKGIKVDKTMIEVSDDEIAKVLGNLQQRMAKAGPDEKKEISPLDDEFAKKVSRFGTLAELNEELKQTMIKDRTAQAEADVRNKLVAEISQDAKVEIPAGMVEREISIMLDELKNSLAQSGLTLEQYLQSIKKEEQTLRDELKKSAEIRVKGKVVLRAVAKAEKIEISDEEMAKEIEEMAKSSGQKPEDLKQRMNQSFKEYVEDYMLRRKALDYVMEKAKIKEVKNEKQSTNDSDGSGAVSQG